MRPKEIARNGKCLLAPPLFIAFYHHFTAGQSDWPCQNCGKLNYPSFNLCWNCQHRRRKEHALIFDGNENLARQVFM